MRSTIRHGVAVAGLAAALGGCTTITGLPPRDPVPDSAILPVIAVSSFDDRSGFGKGWDVGGGMADLLTSELMRSGDFRVVERRHLDKIFGEIGWQKDPRFRPEGRVAEGRLANAEYLIRGVINDFSQVGGGSLFLGMAKYLLGGKGNRARVALTLTIVNVETGEIVDSVQCSGVAWARKAYAEGTYKKVDFGGKAFFDTPLGAATAEAIRRGVRALSREVPRMYWTPMIADIVDGRIVLNGGADRGVAVAGEYQARGAGKRVTDPMTGDVLSVIPGKAVGKVRVVEVGEKISFAVPVNGGGFQRGQYLEPLTPPAAGKTPSP